MLCCALMACKKTTIDFTYSPDAPRAGQTVSFSNISSTGEEWEWAFGDGVASTLKSPTHIYKRPGTYQVILKVDNKKSWTATHEITVYDTVPTFVALDSTFVIYNDYTFQAQIYNPYNYELKYEWSFPLDKEYAVCTDETMTGSSLHCYFTQALDEAPIRLIITVDGQPVEINKTFTVQNQTTNSLLLRTDANDYRQRIFGTRAEALQTIPADPILDAAQDTMQEYFDSIVCLSNIKDYFPGIQGFHIASRKIYYRANGLWVANIDGSYPVRIDEAPCSAMTLDTKDSRIYWANAQGVWYMPFVGSANNKFITVPAQLNDLTGVSKLAPDYEAK